MPPLEIEDFANLSAGKIGFGLDPRKTVAMLRGIATAIEENSADFILQSVEMKSQAFPEDFAQHEFVLKYVRSVKDTPSEQEKSHG